MGLESSGDPDFLTLLADRSDIEALRTEPVLSELRSLLRNDMCQRFRQRVSLGVSGYDADPRELFQIPEVCRWMAAVDQEWPFWFFFLWPGRGSSLPLVILTLCQATTTEASGLARLDPMVMQQVLMSKFTQMNGVCEWLGDSQAQVEKMTQSVLAALEGLMR